MNLRQLAKGQDCKIRLIGCNFNSETTVGAHFRSLSLGAGAGLKPDDLMIAHACSHCHDVCDGRKHLDGWTKNDIRFAHALGVLRTIEWLREEGYIQMRKTA